MITYYNGDLLTSKADVIAHQCNMQGVMGSGVAKQIRETYPKVFEKYKQGVTTGGFQLGSTQFVQVSDTLHIANMLAQQSYGYDGARYTSYDAFYNCLVDLKKVMIADNLSTVAFPYNIGCCRGGASWRVILAMIEDVFSNSGIDVQIWRYDKG
jgi:O-acetyl-ADP-ribose deacetylase (regulator of RNase III)